MTRWWLDTFRRLLQGLLGWVDARLKQSPTARRQGHFFSREIHIPTPLVAVGTAVALFGLLVPYVGFQTPRLFALAGLVVLLTLFFVLYFIVDLPQFVHDDEAVFLTGACLVMGVLMIEVCRVLSDGFRGIPPEFALYGVPLGAVAMIVTLLLNVRLALLLSVVLSIFCGLLNQMSFNAMLVAFFSSAAGMLACRKVRRRSDILWAAFHVMWVSAVCLYGLGLFHGWPVKMIFNRMLWPVVNAGLCAVITLGVLPILESFFSRITLITLLEVGDFNRPLLRQLMLEAPGTYHHTLLVAALAEQAAEAIGANSLLCRVGMYYHDIGKLLHPEYFIENQTMRRSAKDKPEHHDKINPSISSLVIMSHVKDGVALARAHKVPAEVARFIPEHHGTSLIKYFYMRALEQDDDQALPPDAFRYPGPKPHSRETVIGMLADSVEAASRTIEEPTYDRLKDLVEKIVNSKFTDGQFDEAPVTLEDLRKIIDSFANSLSAMYHVRIEYPEFPGTEEPPSPLKKSRSADQ